MNHFINTNASDLSRARTVGLKNLIASPFPVLIVGTQMTHNFFFAADGVVESWSGNSNYNVRVTIGDAFSGPTGGTWSLLVGSGTPFTMPWSIDAAGLQNQLNNDATVIAEGGVYVTEQEPGMFLIAHKTVGVCASIAATTSALVPDCTADVIVLATGSATVRQMVALNLRRNSCANVSSWSTISSPYAGWTGTIDLNTATAIELLRQNGVINGDFLEVTTLLNVDVTDASNNKSTWYQTPVLLRALNYSVSNAVASLTLPVGPTFELQTNSTGNFTIAPASQIHTEFVTISGSAGTRNGVMTATGLVAGARLTVRLTLPATAAIVINLYDLSLTGTLLATVTTDANGYLPTARFEFVFDGTNFKRDAEIVPSFGQQT